MIKKGVSLKVIILVLAAFLISVPLVVFGIIEIRSAAQVISSDIDRSIESDLELLYYNINTVFESVQTKVKSDLVFAEYVLNSSGTVSLDKNRNIELDAVDQTTKEPTRVSLPLMVIGKDPVAYNYRIVDEIREYVGGTATIFQVIPQGLLRISTNVMKLDNTRAVGTYIPTSSPVYKTIMKGDTFYGRAYVVNAWYITAYKPILDPAGGILGVLYVGVQEAPYLEKIKGSIARKAIGETGYFEMVNSKGLYILSHKAGTEGKSSFMLKDDQGNGYMKEIVTSAMALTPGETDSVVFPVSGTHRLFSYFYFEPLDSIVVGSVNEEELIQAEIQIHIRRIVFLVIGFIIAGFIIAFIVAKQIASPLVYAQHTIENLGAGNFRDPMNIKTWVKELKLMGESLDTVMIPQISRIIEGIRTTVETGLNINSILSNYAKDADTTAALIKEEVDRNQSEIVLLDDQITEVSSAVTQILATIENFSAQISNQSSAVTQTSAAVEEMAASLQSIAKITGEKANATSRLKDTVALGHERIRLSNDQIRDIASDVENMLSIIGVINSISAQTNLLSMNAAIEAAHAGEYGAGFAVVADEIRKLAESTGINAKIISDSLKAVVTKMGTVQKAGMESGKAFENVEAEVSDFVHAFTEISQSTREVSEGNREIISAVESLMEISGVIDDGSHEIEQSAVDINNSITAVKESSAKITDEMALVQKSSAEISVAQSDIFATVEWNNANMNEIMGGMKFFTIKENVKNEGDTIQLGLEISNLLIQHQGWLERVAESFSGKSTMDKQEAGDYHNCALGKWLESNGKNVLTDEGLYETMIQNHRQFHNSVADVVIALEDSNTQKARESYAAVRELFHRLVKGFKDFLDKQSL